MMEINNILFEYRTFFDILLRIVLAAVCCGLIGLERELKVKSAGLKTHMIIGIASAVMMVVSKYGFFDLLGINEIIKVDPSRVAASIVSAIGFLGAGIIFVRHHNISGVTTAAGIWATVGIGMLFGSGLYIFGGVTTALVLLIQIAFHNSSLFFSRFKLNTIDIILEGSEDDVNSFIEYLKDEKIFVNFRKIHKFKEHQYLRLETSVNIMGSKRTEVYLQQWRENEKIVSISF